MKKLILAALMLSALAVAGASPNPAEYAVNVHIVASRLVLHNVYHQQLTAIIDGKKYELQSTANIFGVLKLGDYKARLVNDKQRSNYESWQVYEFLFPDNRTRRFVVMEIKE